MTVDELLQRIREAPAMYLAPPSARTLHAFLSGYELGALSSQTEVVSLSKDFGNWLRKRYNLHSEQHWTKIIEFYSSTEGEELSLFWKLYDEFESKAKRKRGRATTGRTAAVRPGRAS
jgi:hypothetical protein